MTTVTDPKQTKEITFRMVGHAHLDPVWLWEWREGYEALKATFRSALDRMAENPDLVYIHSSAAHYHWMEEHPSLLAEIRQAVERGQWEPVGGFWVEPDLNIPSGESLARQGLYGQRYFQQATGRRARIAFLPDSFGHPAVLPQIFAQSGLEGFVFMRPNAREIDLPSNLFWWEGIDGTRILSARVECYNTNPRNVSQSLTRNLDWRPEHVKEWLAVYGVGNHGGGPTKAGIANIRELNADPDWPTLRFGGFDGYFDTIRSQEHPTFASGLQHVFRGCYTTHSGVKRLNRQAEEALLAAEKFAALTLPMGRPYPTADLLRAWRHLLFNQFHDIICGTCIPSAYEDAQQELGEAVGTGRRALYGALQFIAQRVDTRLKGKQAEEVYRYPRHGGEGSFCDLGDGVPLVLFNPNPWPRREVVVVEGHDWNIPSLALLDETGNPVLHQVIRPEAPVGHRKQVAFLAELPPMGYRLYRVVDDPARGPAAPGPTESDTTAVAEGAEAWMTQTAVESTSSPATGTEGMLIAAETHLENRWWRLTIDPETGTLSSLYDKERKLELLAGAGAQLLVMEDRENPWGGDARSFRHMVGAFADARVRLTESGPVRATIAITSRWGRSTATQEISLFQEHPIIDGRLTLNWQESEQLLKLAFPLALASPVATFSAPYGHLVQPAQGDEEPMQQWIDLSGEVRDPRGIPQPYGVALLNDCKYGADALGGELRMTIVRSPYYGAGSNDTPRRLGGYPATDQGEQRVRWQLLPHAGPWQEAGVVRAAHDLNQPVAYIREYVHDGELPPVNSFLTVTPPDAVVVTACKKAEEGDDLILRLYEPAGRQAKASIAIPALNATVAVEANPHQILTYRISPNGAVRTVNFLEE